MACVLPLKELKYLLIHGIITTYQEELPYLKELNSTVMVTCLILTFEWCNKQYSYIYKEEQTKH